jgi:hypothetical protein
MWNDQYIDFELQMLRDQTWDTILLLFNVAVFNQKILPLDVTELAQPLPGRLDLRSRIASITKSGEISYPRNLRWLLRLSHGSAHRECDNDGEDPRRFLILDFRF